MTVFFFVFFAQHGHQVDIIKDAVFTAISAQHALILKSEALVEIGGGVSGVVIEIQPFQRQIAEAVLHHRAHGFSSQALPAQGRIGDINPPKLTLPAALDVGQYDAADFLQ